MASDSKNFYIVENIKLVNILQIVVVVISQWKNVSDVCPELDNSQSRCIPQISEGTFDKSNHL